MVDHFTILKALYLIGQPACSGEAGQSLETVKHSRPLSRPSLSTLRLLLSTLRQAPHDRQAIWDRRDCWNEHQALILDNAHLQAMPVQTWASTSVFSGQKSGRQHWEGGLFELYERCHPLSIPNPFFLELMLMYSSDAQSLSMIRAID